ncbi:hypothetical protein F6V30_15165 [Oryzomonas sagensis]|uniref:Thiol-disulfide oxidoreductase n=1 Tax=Oryzomonas sagensis TaxID=2603857 RepID=A0ABQ6TL40_9BACT|nr:hypothetical protein [Oryzomonas sagensis]KAB0668843.1 hypothetical protein F6V30_15165 [Oryzomonas sagensis]
MQSLIKVIVMRNATISLVVLLCLFFMETGVPASQQVLVYNPAGQREDGGYVDHLLKKLMIQAGVKKPAKAGMFSGAKIEKVAISSDAVAEVNEYFYDRGWTDGLPIIPPTPEKVREMLAATDLSPDMVIAPLEPMGGVATVEKIAVNAVMAGCKPEYLPLLLSAVELVAAPEFDLKGLATTTNPDVPMIIVSGPISKQLAINSGANSLGRGWRANASISRALHLIIQNVGGSWPGVTDMSTIGFPGDFAMMLAENREASPWPPLQTELGVPADANVVMLLAAEGTHSILGIGQSDTGFLNLVAAHLAGLERPYRATMLLIIAQDTAKMLADKGWTRETMTAYIKEHAKIPFKEYRERYLRGAIRKGVPEWVYRIKDPQTMVPSPEIGKLLILVSGGTGEKSILIPGWYDTEIMSKEIRLPSFWEDLLQKREALKK